MAKKKSLLTRAAEMLMEIDEKLDLGVSDPHLHKKVMSLLEDIAEKDDEGPDYLDDEWFFDNGY